MPRHGGCPLLGAWYGISRCCRAGHAGHERCCAGEAACLPLLPLRGPGLHVLTLQREGARALSAWLGRARPALETLPPPERPVAWLGKRPLVPRMSDTQPHLTTGAHERG